MRRMIAIFATCIFLAQISAASPDTKKGNLQGSSPAWEQVGRQALSLVDWDWKKALGEWSLVFGPGRSGYHGMTDFKLHRIDVWVRPGEDAGAIADTISHEIAHAFDYKYLTPKLRSQWLAARGLPPNTPWYFPVGNLATDFLSGAGDFAESVQWTLRGPKAKFQSCLGLRLSAAQRKHAARGCRGVPPDKEQQALIRQWLRDLPKEARR